MTIRIRGVCSSCHRTSYSLFTKSGLSGRYCTPCLDKLSLDSKLKEVSLPTATSPFFHYLRFCLRIVVPFTILVLLSLSVHLPFFYFPQVLIFSSIFLLLFVWQAINDIARPRGY